MPSHNQKAAQPAVQLLVCLEVGSGSVERLKAALAAAPIAALCLEAPAGQGLSAVDLKPLVSIGQQQGAAVLVADDAHLARVVKADGVYLRWQGARGEGGPSAGFAMDDAPIDEAHERAMRAQLDRVADARDLLGGSAIVGAETGDTRECAMRLGEAAIDFIAFGQPDEADRLEFVRWWSDVFEVPCVASRAAMADGDDMAAALYAHGGADFVEVFIGQTTTGRDAGRVVATVADAVGLKE